MGMNDAESVPSPRRFCMMLPTWNAVLIVSAKIVTPK
jgi:hypothetical protein